MNNRSRSDHGVQQERLNIVSNPLDPNIEVPLGMQNR
jgi:hypothetical protein